VNDSVPPVAALFDGVVGQPRAVDALRQAASRPVHAYLLVGEAGDTRRALVRGFAAALLCPQGGCGHCGVCRRALDGIHPDLVEFERAGAALRVPDAQQVVQLAARRPLEAARQVIVVPDLEIPPWLAAPVLLKTLEEPPAPTVLVLPVEFVPPELATVASRCVRVDMASVPEADIRGFLQGRGVDPALAAELAAASGGSVDRARILADDGAFAERLALWRSVPTRLDGTGATAGALAAELVRRADETVEPLRERHRLEMDALEEAAEQSGARAVSGRKDVEARHRRVERRWRTDELRAGLATLAAAYRDRLVTRSGAGEAAGAPTPGGGARLRELSAAVAAVEETATELVRNPNETLMLEALLVRLSAVSA
jgi:DNA polymerase-3 subunit delta'